MAAADPKGGAPKGAGPKGQGDDDAHHDPFAQFRTPQSPPWRRGAACRFGRQMKPASPLTPTAPIHSPRPGWVAHQIESMKRQRRALGDQHGLSPSKAGRTTGRRPAWNRRRPHGEEAEQPHGRNLTT